MALPFNFLWRDMTKDIANEELKSKLKMKIPILDYQHSFLIDLFYKLDNQIPEGENIFKIFLEGNNYLKTHVDAEEKFMKTINYPYYEEHKNEHAIIIDIHGSILKQGLKDEGVIIWNSENKRILSEWRNKHFNIHNDCNTGDVALIKYVRESKNII